ncbi:MAG: antitoxin, Phd family protein [Pseudomonadota bacterium]
MKLSERVRPVDGEAKAVLQDVRSFEATQEALALLEMLALGDKHVIARNVRPVAEAFADIRKRTAAER